MRCTLNLRRIGGDFKSYEKWIEPRTRWFHCRMLQGILGDLKFLIIQVAEELFTNGSVSTLFKCSTTTLLPKKGKDRRFVKNLRPISLLNVAYKMITKKLSTAIRTRDPKCD